MNLPNASCNVFNLAVLLSFLSGEAIIHDLLLIRADREKYYYGSLSGQEDRAGEETIGQESL